MAHETGAMQCLPLPVGEHAPYPGRERQIEQGHLGPQHPHAHQTARQQHQAVTGQGQKDEARFKEEDHHQTGDEQTDCLHLYKLIKILMPYGKQHVLHLV
jgi:hypothetical protein